MAVAAITHWDGTDISAYSGEIMHEDWRGTWGVGIAERARPGHLAALGRGAVGARRITVEFTFTTLADADTLLGILDPLNTAARVLKGTLTDGTAVQATARIEGPHEPTINPDGVNGFRVVFVSADPAWRLVTPNHVDLNGVEPNLLGPINANFDADLTGWAQVGIAGGVTASGSRDAGVFHDAVGSLSLTVTVNGTGANTRLYEWACTTYFPVAPGDVLTAHAWVRTSNAPLTPKLQINWYDSGQAYLSDEQEADWSPSANTWYERDFAATAPANAAYARFLPVVYGEGAGATGSCYFDDTAFYGSGLRSWSSVALNNTGKARAYPVVTIDPYGQAVGTLFGRYRRTLTIANNTGQDLNNEVFEVALGDTTAWVSAANGATAAGDNVYVYRDGQQVARELVAFNRTKSTVWVFVDHLPDDETMTLEVVYGGPAGSPDALTGYRRPAFDHHWEVATVTTGCTTTTIEFSGTPFYADEYDNGHLYVLASAGAALDQGRDITSNDTNTIALGTALSAAPSSGDVVLLRKSWQALSGGGEASRQTYNVLLVERSEAARGLWYASSGQNRPDVVRFDTPGSWEPGSFLENNDERNVPDYLYADVGGSDFDTFTVPDIGRAGQGVYRFPTEGGVYDAVFYHSVFPITEWAFDGSFMNPNGMCKMYAGARANETRAWSDVREVTASTVWGSGHSTFSAVTNDLTTLGDMHHLAFALLPIDEEGIGKDWERITGSRTAGGASGTATVTDATKIGSYANDQFVGWRLVATAGTGSGQARTVSDYVDSTGVFTVSSNFSVSLDDTSRFEVNAPPRIRANLRTNHDFWLTLDYSDVTFGTISAQAANYPIEAVVRVDGGATGTTYPYHRLRIGDDDRRLFLTAITEVLKIDCPNKRAWVEDGSGNELRDVTAYVVPEEVLSATDTRSAREWLPLTVGNHTLYVQQQGITSFDVDVDTAFGYLG